MATLNNVNSYVKFMRGTKEAYQALLTANKVSNDVLYFVYDTADATRGILYLGNKLISGNDTEIAIPSSLNDLTDVVLNALDERQVLVYNGTQWINSTLEEVLLIDQNAFAIDTEAGLTLYGFKNATVGQMPQKGEDGKLTWVAPSDLEALQEVTQSITNLENNKANKADVFTKEEVKAEIAKSNHLQYKIVDDVDDIDPTAAGADLFIYLVPTGDTVEGNLYYEYMVIEKKVEQVGKWTVDLSNYVTNSDLNKKLEDYVLTSVFETTVGSLNDQISNINTAVQQNADDIEALYEFNQKVGNIDDLILNDSTFTTLIEQVNDLTLRLTWEEIPPTV